MELIDEPKIAIAHLTALGLIERSQVHACNQHIPIGWQVEPPQEIQQGRLA